MLDNRILQQNVNYIVVIDCNKHRYEVLKKNITFHQQYNLLISN